MLKNKVDALLAKKEKVKIPDTDIEIEIGGLTFSELAKFSKFSDNRDVEGALNFLLFTTFRKAIPKEGENGMTDEEINNIIKNMDSSKAIYLIQKIQELSGLKAEDIEKEKK